MDQNFLGSGLPQVDGEREGCHSCKEMFWTRGETLLVGGGGGGWLWPVDRDQNQFLKLEVGSGP